MIRRLHFMLLVHHGPQMNANKRQVKHISSSIEPPIPFRSLVNMVATEDFTLEKFKTLKTLERVLSKNALSDKFNKVATFKNTSAKCPQKHAVDPNTECTAEFKKVCNFCHKNNHSGCTCYRRINMLQESKPQSIHLFLPFINNLKHPPTNTTIKLLVIVVEVIVIMIKNSFENLDINLILTLAQTLVQNNMTSTLLPIFLRIMIVTDLAMVMIIENVLHKHFILLAHITILNLLEAHYWLQLSNTFKPREDTSLLSKLELSFLLDSGASI